MVCLAAVRMRNHTVTTHYEKCIIKTKLYKLLKSTFVYYQWHSEVSTDSKAVVERVKQVQLIREELVGTEPKLLGTGPHVDNRCEEWKADIKFK